MPERLPVKNLTQQRRKYRETLPLLPGIPKGSLVVATVFVKLRLVTNTMFE